MQRQVILLGAALGLALFGAAACKKSASANVAAKVNNRAITYAELDKQYQSQYPQQPEGSSADQVTMQKLELLRNLIDSEIMVQRAEKLGLMAGDADVEAKLN
jgi:peptidyl-prolyl cis-trans isomerase SurA